MAAAVAPHSIQAATSTLLVVSEVPRSRRAGRLERELRLLDAVPGAARPACQPRRAVADHLHTYALALAHMVMSMGSLITPTNMVSRACMTATAEAALRRPAR